ncbi:UMP kinase [Vallitalea okinawensis]|uniref:UMP kinase n=1 Tax=Vallitalea okinawensis TaxID=2078660 RepID=UPI000CFCBDCA|nr:UMP kinase [Vallitalea okinawensis]
MYSRVLLKLSGEALAGEKGFGFDEGNVLIVADQVKRILNKGTQVSIVIGGGNFWRGRSSERMDRTKADQIGMMATIMNAIYASEVFRGVGIKTVVQTPFPVGTMTETFSKDSAVSHLKNGTVVFFAGGTGHPYFSTDTGAALRGIETDCDILLFAKNIDGVYDSDPSVNPEAKKYDEIQCSDIVKNGLRVIDITAASLCSDNNMPVLIFGLNEEDSIVNAIEGKKIGTIVRT